MKSKVVKMGLAIVMSVSLLAGCGGSSNADNYKNDVKAFAALQNVDNTDFEAMSKAVEDLNMSTSEGQSIMDDMMELVNITKDAMESVSGGEEMDEESLAKLQEDIQAATEKTQTDLQAFIKAAEDAGVDDSDMEGLSEELGL